MFGSAARKTDNAKAQDAWVKQELADMIATGTPSQKQAAIEFQAVYSRSTTTPKEKSMIYHSLRKAALEAETAAEQPHLALLHDKISRILACFPKK